MTDKTLDFSKRHIGLKDSDVEHILHDLGYQNVDTFFKELVPDSIFNLDNLLVFLNLMTFLFFDFFFRFFFFFIKMNLKIYQ